MEEFQAMGIESAGFGYATFCVSTLEVSEDCYVSDYYEKADAPQQNVF
jgi:hypothetical protein